MRLVRENLVVQFSVLGFVVLAAIAVIVSVVLSNKIESDAVDALIDGDRISMMLAHFIKLSGPLTRQRSLGLALLYTRWNALMPCAPAVFRLTKISSGIPAKQAEYDQVHRLLPDHSFPENH